MIVSAWHGIDIGEKGGGPQARGRHERTDHSDHDDDCRGVWVRDGLDDYTDRLDRDGGGMMDSAPISPEEWTAIYGGGT